MPTSPKYKAKPVFFDFDNRVVIDPLEIDKLRTEKKLRLPKGLVRFDSQHEFGVYLELCRMYGAERVRGQYRVEIYAPGLCYPRGKEWRVDFAITTSKCNPIPIAYVEAKGAFLPEFGFTLAALEHLQPSVFHKLHIVFGACVPAHNKIVSSLLNSDFNHRLFTLKEMKCLQHLPFPL
jgi:hypothetical protein